MFSGYPVGIFLLAMVGRLIKKRMMLLISMGISAVGMGLMVWRGTLISGGAGMFCSVFGSNISLNLIYTIPTETVSPRHRSNFSIMIMVTYALGGLLNVLWFYLFRDFRSVLLFCDLVPGLFVIAALIFFIKDLPMCMITKSTPEKTLRTLEFIAKMNSKHFDLTIGDIKSIKEEYRILQKFERNRASTLQ